LDLRKLSRCSKGPGSRSILVISNMTGYVARFNIAPSQTVPIIVKDSAGVRRSEMKWGWKTHWSKQLLISAKAENVKTMMFSKHLNQRCLVPADGFYEWLPDKTPVRFTKPDKGVFCFAGLWNVTETKPLDEPAKEHSFVILTTSPNETVSPGHNRMPLIVRPERLFRNLS
jgi:putative SOS response-associated peptidase YedK